MDRLVEEGLIIVGGGVGTGEHTAHLIESEDPGEIRARLVEDPWAKDNHLMVGALDARRLLTGGSWRWCVPSTGIGLRRHSVSQRPARTRRARRCGQSCSVGMVHSSPMPPWRGGAGDHVGDAVAMSSRARTSVYSYKESIISLRTG